MSRIIEKFGMGWLRDYPDFRDYTAERTEVPSRLKLLGQKDSVRAMLTKAGVADPAKLSLPTHTDLREWCTPIEDQGTLGSCTANAGVGLVEYFEKRAFGKHIDASRLFLYKVTRNLSHLTGDTGAYLRTTTAALTLFGVPPTEYWPYEIDDFDKEPTAFCYAFAQNYQAIQYFRLDPPGTQQDVLLTRIKAFLAAGLPSMFGFTVFSSMGEAETTGKIPYPTPGETREGGHAVAAVGYDDKMKIKNTNPEAGETIGALLIRNSWGTGWGDSGFPMSMYCKGWLLTGGHF